MADDGRRPPEVLRSLPRLGYGVGLHRVAELCRDLLDDPWLTGLDAIKVTGSNGKGSVAAMTAAILGAAGVEVGLATSPHLFDFRERIRLGDRLVPEGELASSSAWLEAELDRYRRLHPGDEVAAFEATCALTFHFFARHRPATVVAEAGIGGRYDPTRLLPGRTTALVSLDLEHTAILGKTLAEIACDKADLAADGTTLVVGEVEADLLRRLRGYGRARGIEVVEARELCRVRRVGLDGAGMRVDLDYGGEPWDDVDVALLGEHQAANAAVAVALAGGWLERHRPAAGIEAAVRAGLGAVRWPCRLEKVGSDPDVWVDAGHTPAALAALVASARRILAGRRVTLVTGVSADKDPAPIVGPLLALADRAIVTRAHHRGAAVPEVAAVAAALAPERTLEAAATVEEALAAAIETASADGSVVLVAGGLFLAAEAAETVRGGDPRRLSFL